MTYFEEVVQKLNLDDLTILGILFDKEINAAFKSISNKELMKEASLSKSKYFNSINRLFATCLTQSIDSKRSRVFITEHGIQALQKTLEGVN